MRTNTTIMSLVLVLLLLPAVVSADDVNTTIRVVPSSIDTSVGEEFGIDVVIDPGGEAVYSAQYKLLFDPDILEALSQEEGDLLNEGGAANTIEIVNSIDNEGGNLQYGLTRMGVVTGVTATGTLAHVTFRVIGGDRGSRIELTDVIVGNPIPEEMPVSVESGVCFVDGKPPYVASTPADAVIALQMAVRGEYSAKADVNHDDKVTSLDALMILQTAAGNIEL